MPRAAELLQVDVDLPDAPAERAVALRLAPAELLVLDEVRCLGHRSRRVDEVRHAVAVAVGEVGRVVGGVDPVDAEVGAARGRARRLGDACSRCPGDRTKPSVGRASRTRAWCRCAPLRSRQPRGELLEHRREVRTRPVCGTTSCACLRSRGVEVDSGSGPAARRSAGPARPPSMRTWLQQTAVQRSSSRGEASNSLTAGRGKGGLAHRTHTIPACATPD